MVDLAVAVVVGNAFTDLVSSVASLGGVRHPEVLMQLSNKPARCTSTQTAQCFALQVTDWLTPAVAILFNPDDTVSPCR